MVIFRNKTRLFRLRLKKLLKSITPEKGWGDLALPEAEKKALRQVIEQARDRKGGLVVLFEGESGAGKSMAAEVMAGELMGHLYRVDLSVVISKYIGETEKNLKQIFNAAEGGHAVLMFDEADALFGKRTEVKDSHDRHANLEASHLLQRMGAYPGLIILSRHSTSKLDPEVRRLLRFNVRFS